MEFLILLIPVAAILLWLVTEFFNRRWLRIIAGFIAIATVSTCTYLAADFTARIETNANFGHTNTRLLDATIAALERGEHERARQALTDVRNAYRPKAGWPYFDRLVDQAAHRMAERADAATKVSGGPNGPPSSSPGREPGVNRE